MNADVWDIWSIAKLKVVQKARKYLKQPYNEPHFNYFDQQPNHVSEEFVKNQLPLLESSFLFNRNYPARSTLFSQAVDQHIGRTIQQKVLKCI